MIADTDLHLAKPNDQLHAMVGEHRRLAILRLLTRLPGHTGNDELLADIIGQMGLRSTFEVFRADLSFLEKAGLVRRAEVNDLWVIELLQSGDEVARGLRSAPGVLEVRPGCKY